MTAPLPEISSLWMDTAARAPRFPAQAGTTQCDVAIIGGGYTGLSTAHHLTQAGLAPVVLEASRIGWGASGRNGGVVSAKFRISSADIAGTYDLAMARRMAQIANESVELIGELVDTCNIPDAGFMMSGNLKCAHNAVSMDKLRAEQQWLATNMGDTGLRIQSAAEVAEETGSRDFVGGLLNPHGGLIHPLNFVRGLAESVSRAGVPVFEQSPVRAMRRDGERMLLETPSGTVSAKQVVIATNAYSDLTPATVQVQRTLVPFRSALIATEPLTTPAFAKLLATNRSYTETRRMMRWFRRAGDRILFGGRGAFGKADSAAATDALRRKMVAIFPELASVQVTHRWSGLVGMTLDSVPHVGRLDPYVSYAVGYNGAGVAMSTLMGRYLARIVQGETPELGLLWAPHLKKLPFYPVREPAVRMVAGWYQFLDAIGR
ncbi:FAD-binding oxidoreductase [Pigmentiphaga aceris]|uniref:FAD-binding oxidoreductase n=1 Tax=Pigmentiphaga aceris TaxID=1940612 RepID=A0A5C0B1L7_9BURK|nr:FAD-binding oxidoreductase [Pigmentiphaga aceris]QEI08472.1 FAD-binding oxidoreductase [Pigmentiphaga aceris]